MSKVWWSLITGVIWRRYCIYWKSLDTVFATIIDSSWFLPKRREHYFVGIRLDLLRNERSSLVRPLLLQLEVELRKKYQIHGNDITNAATMDNCDRVNNTDHPLSLPTAITYASSFMTPRYSRESQIRVSWPLTLLSHPYTMGKGAWSRLHSIPCRRIRSVIDRGGSMLSDLG